MEGRILFTNRAGGMIGPEDRTQRSVPFSWSDCEGFGPSDIGHGCLVEFYIEIIGRNERAIAVRRQIPRAVA